MTVRTGLLTLAVAGGVALGPATALHAQDEGGLRLSFGLSQRVEASRNQALAAPAQGTTLRTDTRGDFTFSSITRNQSLTFSGDAAIRAVNGPNGDESLHLADPGLSLSYARQGAGSEFTLSAGIRRREIAFARPFTDFLDSNGLVVLPDDPEDLRGEGQQLSYRAESALRWGQDGPFGIGISAGINGARYSNVTATNLFDYQRRWVALETKMAPAPAHNLSTTLRYSRFEDDDPTNPDSDRIAVNSRWSVERPNGQVYGAVGLDRGDRGTRYSLSGGWTREQATRKLSLSLGATRMESGNLSMTGSAAVNQSFATGTLGAQLRRSVSDGRDNAEQVVTALALSFARPLGPRTNLSLGVDYARTTQTSTDNSVTNAALRASISHALTPDWNMNFGYTRGYRKDDSAGTGWANSDTVFLGVSRRFTTRW